MALTKATYGMISADTSTIDLNIDANTLYVDSSANRVGIGTNSPDAPLRINQDANEVAFKVTGGGSGLNLAEFVRDVGATATIAINASGADPQMYFTSTGNTFSIGVNSNSFEIADSQHLGTNTRLSIDYLGNIGIGTTTPGFLLEVKADKDTWVSRIYNTGSDANAQALLVRSDATAAHNALVMGVYADSGYKMVVKSSGNVGIGTDSPATKLMLEHYNDGAVGGTIRIKDRDSQQSANQLTGAIEFESQDATTPTSGVSTAIKAFAASSTGGSYLTISTTDVSTSTLDERMRITSSGNVGIGTTAPASTLHINSTGETELTISGGGANYHNGAIVFKATNSTSYRGLGIYMHDAGGDHEWYAGTPYGASDQYQIGRKATASHSVDTNATANAFVTVKNDGNVLIGTASSPFPNGTGLAVNSSGTISRLILQNSSTGTGTTDGMRIGAIGTNLEIENVENGNIEFYNNGSERMRISSSGQVSIGTTSTTAPLRVKVATDANFAVQNTSSTVQLQGINDAANAFTTIDIAGNPIKFSANGSESMRINSSGSLLVGTTNASPANVGKHYLTIETDDTTTAGIAVGRFASSDVASRRQVTFFNANGTVGTIFTNASATSYNTSSDYRLKENVDYTWDATTRLKQLKPARFNFIADADTIVEGFLAHEVQDIVPEAVTGEKDGAEMQGIDQSKLVPLLVKTIQELEARIKTLEDK